MKSRAEHLKRQTRVYIGHTLSNRIMNRPHLSILLASASLAALTAAASAQTSATAKIDHPAIGKNLLKLEIHEMDGKPLLGAKVTLSVGMANMDMGIDHPKAIDMGHGIYQTEVRFSMAGPWTVSAKIISAAGTETTKAFSFTVGSEAEMNSAMAGRLGTWSMSKEGSGTSWLPESSPMFMKMLEPAGRYELSVMGYITANFTSSGGLRGQQKSFSNSMPMLMATRGTGGGTLGMSLMLSLDPIFNGQYGYPNLFQTGETAYGTRLEDVQHPHNLVSELTASYSHPIGSGVSAFLYGGPIGEPALGGPTFAHRPSGNEIPEAPITHHWFDSTHISSGVVTLGLNTSHWQLEGSSFNGHEPGENRYWPQPIAFNSASGRLTYSPNKNLSFNTSYGVLNQPESTAPGQDQRRFTGSAILSLPMPHGDNFSTTAYFGEKTELGVKSDAYTLEATYLHGPDSIFARWENVNETELPDVPAGSYRVNKVLFGDVHNFAAKGGLELGLGGYIGLYSFPSELVPFYGNHPVTLGVFLRLRPSRMDR